MLRKAIPTLSILALALLPLACTKGTDDGGEEKESPAAKGSAPSAEVVAVLAKADAADGTVDKVVSKCINCNLGMAGKEEYSVTVGEYEVHLCSEECQTKVSEEPSVAILAVEFPEAEGGGDPGSE